MTKVEKTIVIEITGEKFLKAQGLLNPVPKQAITATIFDSESLFSFGLLRFVYFYFRLLSFARSILTHSSVLHRLVSHCSILQCLVLPWSLLHRFVLQLLISTSLNFVSLSSPLHRSFFVLLNNSHARLFDASEYDKIPKGIERAIFS